MKSLLGTSAQCCPHLPSTWQRGWQQGGASQGSGAQGCSHSALGFLAPGPWPRRGPCEGLAGGRGQLGGRPLGDSTTAVLPDAAMGPDLQAQGEPRRLGTSASLFGQIGRDAPPPGESSLGELFAPSGPWRLPGSLVCASLTLISPCPPAEG